MAKLTYVLLSEEEYEKVRESGILAAHNVGAKKNASNGFPIFFDIESACVHARKTYLAGQRVAPAPQSENIWQSITFRFTESQMLAHLMPQNDEPLFSVTKDRINVRGELNLEKVPVVVENYKFFAYTVEEWATARLPKRRKINNETCGTCGKMGSVAWRGSLGNHLRHKAPEDDDKPKAYCAGCWDAYFVAKK